MGVQKIEYWIDNLVVQLTQLESYKMFPETKNNIDNVANIQI